MNLEGFYSNKSTTTLLTSIIAASTILFLSYSQPVFSSSNPDCQLFASKCRDFCTNLGNVAWSDDCRVRMMTSVPDGIYQLRAVPFYFTFFDDPFNQQMWNMQYSVSVNGFPYYPNSMDPDGNIAISVSTWPIGTHDVEFIIYGYNNVEFIEPKSISFEIEIPPPSR
jgi:hypothetical protein